MVMSYDFMRIGKIKERWITFVNSQYRLYILLLRDRIDFVR